MRKAIMRLARLAPVLGAVALAGCGASTSSSGPTRSKPVATTPAANGGAAAYVAQADAICQQGRAALAQFNADARTLRALGDTPKAFALAAGVTRQIQALEQGELGRLRALRLPPGDTSKVTAYFDQEGIVLASIGRLASAFAKGDRAGIAAAERDSSQLAATGKGLAQGYGFKVCGNGTAGTGLS